MLKIKVKKANKQKKTDAVKKAASVGKSKSKVGNIVHSNDKYFQGTDGYSKNRESVVIDRNCFENLALVKLTTKQNKNTGKIPSYSAKTYFDKRNVYIKDNEGNFINMGNAERLSDSNKFVKSKFKGMSASEVEFIKQTVLSDKKYGTRNKKRLNQIKKRKR